MFYKTQTGKEVFLFNKRPRNLSRGGMIRGNRKIRDKNEDTISSYLEYGSLVIPIPVVRSGVMREYKGPIEGPPTTARKNLSPTVVMPGEIVVNRRYAKDVERFLLSKGIRLPLPQ